MSDTSNEIAYVRTEEAPLLPPPPSQVGFFGWLWRNMFQSMSNFSTPGAAFQSSAMIVATVAVGYFAIAQIAAFLNFAVFDAIWTAEDGIKRLACATEAQGGDLPREWFGACYPYISAKWKFLIYYSYPADELWRVNIVFLLGALGIARMVAESVSQRIVVGVVLIGAGVAYGLLVQRMFGEALGVRVGVQILIGIGLLYMWLRLESDRAMVEAIGPARDWILRLVLTVLLIALAVFASQGADGEGRGLIQSVMLRAPLIAMVAALLFAPVGWNGAMLLTAFPLYAFVLLTGGHFEIDQGAMVSWGVVAAALIAFGWFGGRGAIGEIGEAFGGLAMTVGGVIGAGVLVTAVAAIDFGLETVDTGSWGGLLVTLVVAVVGIVFSLPLGVLLALGRRSSLPAVRYLSIAFIEFWRGVPLITVLFMSSVMLPLFLPQDVDFNKLLRALIGVMMFAAAYQAEVVRGGLAAIPKGQFEGAQALGLSYWKMMGLIVLPQALTLVIPGIVNTFIGLFKDTSLVLIISLFDLLGAVQAALTDAEWATPVQASTGYLTAAAIFWLFCFGMSRYSLFMEQKLRKGRAR